MAVVWNAVGAVGAGASILAIALGLAVLFARAGNRYNRIVAACLLLDGLGIGGSAGFLYLTDDPRTAFAWQAVGMLATLLTMGAYLLLLSTLDTPLARPFRSRAGRVALSVVLVANVVLFFARQDLILVGVAPADVAAWDGVFGPLADWYLLAFLLVLVYALVVAVSAWRRAQDPLARARSRAFVLAFGTRDALLALGFLGVLFHVEGAGNLSVAVTVLIYVPLLAYVLLSKQLFHIDLRIKLGIQRSTVGAMFVLVYLVASELARALVTPRWGIPAGLAAAALLLLALSPLQRASERLASTLMPGVTDAPAYHERRKLEIYRAAIADARAKGGERVLPEDEAFLARLRASLGLSERDHALLALALRAPDDVAPLDAIVATGRFRIERELGEGSFGRAYLAHDTRLDRRVVLKVLGRAGEDADALLREARALARVRHPHVLTVHDAERIGRAAFLVTEHAEGGSLRERLGQGPLAGPELARLARGLLGGLGAIHAAGLVHRDIKPSNVLLDAKGEALLADFGIAHLPGFETTAAIGAGAAAGTVAYMSPEQARGRPAGAASDLYSAALVLYEAATGERYHEARPGESAVELQMAIAKEGQPRTPPGAGEAQARWWTRALAPDPARRFPDAATMLRELEAANS